MGLPVKTAVEEVVLAISYDKAKEFPKLVPG